MTINKHCTGVTLIELMIVVAILAIISAVAIPAFTDYIETGRKHECQQEVGTLALAEEEFMLEQGSYFLGADVGTLQGPATGSLGLWSAAEQTAANRNCTYAVTAGTTGSIATSFNITATGSNKLGTSYTLQKGN